MEGETHYCMNPNCPVLVILVPPGCPPDCPVCRHRLCTLEEAKDFAYEKVKEAIRDGVVGSDAIDDALWHLSNLASDVGLDLAEGAHVNLKKPAGRAKRGGVQGPGDHR